MSNQNSWFSPPKTSLTLSSVKMRRIESVSSSAQLSTRRLSGAPENVRVLPCAELLTDSIRRIFVDDSVSEVFGGENQLF